MQQETNLDDGLEPSPKRPKLCNIKMGDGGNTAAEVGQDPNDNDSNCSVDDDMMQNDSFGFEEI